MEDWCAGRGRPSWHENTATAKLFPRRHQMDGIVYPVPAPDDVDNFGLGIEFNEEYAIELEQELEERGFEYSSPPNLRRRDGSWTNW
jgi:galactonate dehydratase